MRMFSQHMPAHLLLTMQRLAKERTGDTQARSTAAGACCFFLRLHAPSRKNGVAC